MERSGHQRSQPLDEVIALTERLSAADKLRLLRILADELDTNSDIAPFEFGKTYYVATPYDVNGDAAQVLADALEVKSD